MKNRPNGPGDSSPGLRPKADALGWGGRAIKAACKVARALLVVQLYPEALAALQAAWRLGLLTQGIGLRPQPWARISRPVGPVLLTLIGKRHRIKEPHRINDMR